MTFWTKARKAFFLGTALTCAPLIPTASLQAADGGAVHSLKPYADRPATDDVIYFVMPDRFANGDPSNDTGGIAGGAKVNGFDPTNKGFYHGGDIKGLISKLDYLQDMGVTAIWFTPIFKNKAVQGDAKHLSAGYHGYWITDFTSVDPHLGTNDDLKALVTEAHKRNMKVIFDIIVNHTADVIQYRECTGEGNPGGVTAPGCKYRSLADYPYTHKGGKTGPAINKGFAGDGPAHQTEANFAKLTNPDYAYTPYVPKGEEHIKKPDWLNNVLYYHNRGNTTFQGENSLYGDFGGLDDVFTENPAVVKGFTKLYESWIKNFKIDGYRIDTARHVNDSFWQKFSPAIIKYAAKEGIPHFYMFGEVYDGDPKRLSHFTTVAKLPAVLDFGFQGAVTQVLAHDKGTDVLAKLFSEDSLYGPGVADTLPTFLGNHDMGRFGHFLREAHPHMSDAEMMKRTILGNALMFFARGVPVIYYGDEQGFVGDGGDQDAREDMFPSKVASYNDNKLIGTDATTAVDNFNENHPLYRSLKAMAALYHANPALRQGKQKVLMSSPKPGLFVFSRTDKASGETVLVVVNTAKEAMTYKTGAALTPMTDGCTLASDKGETDLHLAPLSYAVCRMGKNN
ncbi:alpha-amylase family glycosyl hydrolase [Kordiimonas marina]|uniref:alpha-amylase family glycosyl hydrolase n=1 Tax=Kordiimonas marina TaxID=2872312 RepID=UPI001FF2047F|nr:alpha-amylase family glycosyl hydrolase [Kordiimonas marina]MCJ9428812.1 alpha-amylase [Kordiimonas marina]